MAWHTCREDMRIKTIDLERVFHSSYLANTLSSFVSLTDQLILYNPAHFVSCVCQLLNCENGICEIYYSQNIVENKDLLSDPKVVILKRNIHGKSRLFSSGFS